jgi:Glycosyltransferase like family 2
MTPIRRATGRSPAGRHQAAGRRQSRSEARPTRGGRWWLAVALAGTAVYHLWRWRADRALADDLRRRLLDPPPTLSAAPKVSILVAAWNEAAFIERHIASVLALRYPNLEYVLCAGGSDGTYDVARAYADRRVTLLEQGAGEGKQRALRKAFARSTGEIIFLTDADCLLDDRSFERTIEPLVAGREVAASGDSLPLPEQLSESAFARYQGAVQEYAAAHASPYVGGLLGRNAAIDRATLCRIGAFTADAPTGTDYRLAKAVRAAGHKIRHVPDSVVRTEYPDSLRAYHRQQRRWLRNVLLLGRQAAAWGEVRQAAQTSLIGAAMLLWPLAGLVLGRGLLALWCAAFVHSAAAKVRYTAFLGRVLGRSSPGAALLAPVFALMDFGVWALPLLDYPFAGRRHQW